VTMSPLLWIVSGAIAALTLAAEASAQPVRPSQAPTDVSPVTVTGVRPADQETIKTIIAPFVALHAAPSRKTGLLVRIPHTGVCPATLGLPGAYNDFVDRRIREVARKIGAGVEPKGHCQPNVQVLFTADPQGVVNALSRRTGGAILGMHTWRETVQIVRVTRPIQAWWVTGTVNDTKGTNTVIIGADGVQDTGHGRAVIDSAYGPGMFTGSGSHVPPRNSGQIVNALIVVDTRKLADHPIGPVADYVAALALSQARSLDRCSKLPSILDLFATDCPDDARPQALTDSDFSFLRALYTSDVTTSGARGRDQVERKMAKDLPPTEPEPEPKP
jgi:hypothetical protein